MNIKILIIVVVSGLVTSIGLSFLVGYMLCKPAQSTIKVSGDLPFESLTIKSKSGSELKGWKLDGLQENGVILLFHSLLSNRTSLIDRARMLWNNGYTVILFDFQAHGESKGKHITFGYLESKDVESIYGYVKNIYPGKNVGAIGISLGGASILLRKDVTPFDAIVLEAVYPTVEEATYDRIERRLGFLAQYLTPLMLTQLKAQIGITKHDLRPIDNIKKQSCPIFIIAGQLDQHTKITESKRLFSEANEPKRLWIIENAFHEDFYKKRPKEYEEKVLLFFREHLRIN